MTKKEVAKIRISPWIIWGLGAAFFFFEYIVRVSPEVMASELMRAFHIDAFSLGSLSAFFYYAYVGMQLPVGVLVDKFGPRRLLAAMSTVCAAGLLMLSYATHFRVAEVARFLIGFSASFGFVGALKLASVWFPSYRFALLAGTTQALGMLGAAIGEGPVAGMVDALGWRVTTEIMAGIFFLLAILIGLLVRDYPKNYNPGKSPSNSNSKENILTGLRHVLSNPQTWYNALFAGLIYAPTAAFGELWGATFFKHAYGLSNTTAATAVSFIFIGWGVGGPLIGWFSDYIRLRKPLMIASAISGFILLSIVLYVPNLPLTLIYILLFLYGISNTSVAIAYAVCSEINLRKFAGTSLAFTNMASVLIGTLLQPLIGWLIDLNWDGKTVHGAPVYSATDLHIALFILPCCLVLGGLVSLKIKETHCQSMMD